MSEPPRLVRKVVNGVVIYEGVDRRRMITHIEALHKYPKLRSISSLFYRKELSTVDVAELQELQTIIRHQEHNWEVEERRLQSLVSKWGINKLKEPLVAVKHYKREAKEDVTLRTIENQCNVVSSIYQCVYPNVSKKR